MHQNGRTTARSLITIHFPPDMTFAGFLLRALCLFVWLGIVPLSRADELPDISRISIEDARNLLETNTEGVWLRDFCDAAIKSGRKDVIELCMVKTQATAYITIAMERMPDTPLWREPVVPPPIPARAAIPLLKVAPVPRPVAPVSAQGAAFPIYPCATPRLCIFPTLGTRPS